MRRWLAIFSLLAMLLSGIGMASTPSPLSRSDPPAKPFLDIPFTDVNPLGANFFLDREVELWKKELTLKMAQEAGLGWVKMLFSWESLEPRKGQFWDERYKKSTWDKYD